MMADEIEYHTDVDEERFGIKLMQIKHSFFSELFEELIGDLCIYLQCYGSAYDIRLMEEKYGFDYEETLEKIGYNH